MADDTIFHRIIRREIPADIVHEDEHVIAFRDISPQAPVHVLFVPKETVPTLDALQPGQEALVGRLVLAAASSRRSTLVRARSPADDFSIRKWRSAIAAICGRWVMQSTWRPSPSPRS